PMSPLPASIVTGVGDPFTWEPNSCSLGRVGSPIQFGISTSYDFHVAPVCPTRFEGVPLLV
ncbi:MAG: hypothetical protein DSM106950_45060, partial [Stigonema ocellatum SAG 48.90 = DSM 106950]|nr:hypothetical protein [Stigonema ocellatum SAG 48.90 = DSM 106950]